MCRSPGSPERLAGPRASTEGRFEPPRGTLRTFVGFYPILVEEPLVGAELEVGESDLACIAGERESPIRLMKFSLALTDQLIGKSKADELKKVI